MRQRTRIRSRTLAAIVKQLGAAGIEFASQTIELRGGGAAEQAREGS